MLSKLIRQVILRLVSDGLLGAERFVFFGRVDTWVSNQRPMPLYNITLLAKKILTKLTDLRIKCPKVLDVLVLLVYSWMVKSAFDLNA